MKKTTKKLVLAKETVRGLTAPELEQAAGGAISLDYPCQTSNGPLICFCPK
jgi:hypothetical protein